MHEHEHHHDHPAPPAGAHDSGRRLTRALLATLAFAAVEAFTGWWAGSLALLADAGHMLADASSLALAALAAWIARRPADHEHSWGHGRAEVLAALGNALLMIVLVGGIVAGVIQRLRTPVPVQAFAVILVAGLGLALNLLVLRMLSHGHQTLNTRGALLHVIGDALGSVAALVAGAVVLTTGWTPIDPLLSLVICGLILISAVRLLLESLNVVMEGVPRHLDLEQIGRAMARTGGVVAVHDLHIWTVRSDQVALSAHVVLWRMGEWPATMQALGAMLARDYGIRHATLQPEPIPEVVLPDPRLRTARGAPP